MAESIEAFPFLSVIIPTYRDWKDLRNCLDALAEQDYPPDRFEVLIVNNDDSGCECPFSLPSKNMRLLCETTPGSYAARNKGIEDALGDILVFTDADCLPHPQWLSRGAAIMKECSQLHRLAGLVEIDPVQNTAEACYDRLFSFDQRLLSGKGTSVTANMWAKRVVFDVVGPFSTEFLSGEDTQWGLRAKAAGFSIQLAESVLVRHAARSSFDALLKKAIRVYGGWYEIQGWRHRPLFVRLLFGFYQLRPPLVALKRIVFSRDCTRRRKVSMVRILLKIRLRLWLEHFRLALGRDAARS